MSQNMKVEKSGDREVIISRSFNAPRERVWACYTTPKLLKRWLLGPPGWTMPICEIDLRLGGRYRYVWRDPKGVDMGVSGVYKDIAMLERIVTAERYDENWTGGGTLVTQRFTQTGMATLVTMTVRYSSATARDGAMKTGMATGIEKSYLQLDGVLADPTWSLA